MRTVVLVLALVMAATLALTAVASAQQFPSVAGLKPFSAETNFMSLPGYLRWLVFQQSANWITYQEAARIAAQQQASR